MEITIKLSLEELNSLLQVLGQMQNSSNTYPLLTKIRKQGIEQVNNAAATPPAE